MSHLEELQIVRHALATDQPGPCPRDLSDTELPQFMAVRERYDRPLQVAGAIPLAPQASCRNANDFERQLLGDLARRTAGYNRLDCASIPDEQMPRYRERILADSANAPYREGTLREVVMTDGAGREVHEFVGPKSWMSAYTGPAILSAVCIGGVPQAVPTVIS
jgi:hypothetical protein